MTLEQIVKDLERRVDLYREESRKKRCPELFYRSRGLYEALAMLTASLDGRAEILTLRELAHELRKLFKFDILTYSAWEDGDCYVTEQLDEIVLWCRRVPGALPEYDETAGNFYGDAEVIALLKISSMSAMISACLDFAEYREIDGNIDYRKCIVEVDE